MCWSRGCFLCSPLAQHNTQSREMTTWLPWILTTPDDWICIFYYVCSVYSMHSLRREQRARTTVLFFYLFCSNRLSVPGRIINFRSNRGFFSDLFVPRAIYLQYKQCSLPWRRCSAKLFYGHRSRADMIHAERQTRIDNWLIGNCYIIRFVDHRRQKTLCGRILRRFCIFFFSFRSRSYVQ